ncbi:MAG: GNAT family N-acetyltransferase, partial [Cyclobacteriaceae bacterium]
KRKIKKCEQEGIKFLYEGSEKLSEVYAFIEQCRNAQGLLMNITYDQLKKAFDTLSDAYEIYSVRDKLGELLAATITVRVNKAVVYNYLPAFDRAYKSLSPLAFLTRELVLACQRKGYHYIDLGISSIDGKIQEGLATFKERMGGIRSKRYTYEFNF